MTNLVEINERLWRDDVLPVLVAVRDRLETPIPRCVQMLAYAKARGWVRDAQHEGAGWLEPGAFAGLVLTPAGREALGDV